MCRSSADGGRRCTGADHTRNRALNTAHRRVQRADHALTAARATGDPDAIHTAHERLDQARQHLVDTHATHPHTPDPTVTPDTSTSHTPGAGGEHSTAGEDGDATSQHDTSEDSVRGGGFTVHNTNYATGNATVGLQTDMSHGPTTFTTDRSTTHTGHPSAEQMARAAQRVRQAAQRMQQAAAEQATPQPRHSTNTADGDDHVNVQIGLNYGDLYRRSPGGHDQ